MDREVLSTVSRACSWLAPEGLPRCDEDKQGLGQLRSEDYAGKRKESVQRVWAGVRCLA